MGLTPVFFRADVSAPNERPLCRENVCYEVGTKLAHTRLGGNPHLASWRAVSNGTGPAERARPGSRDEKREERAAAAGRKPLGLARSPTDAVAHVCRER